jgi:hypothetical protein
MDTLELAYTLILAFILFFTLGMLVSLILVRAFFKPLTKEQLQEWRTEELREWETTKTLLSKSDKSDYTMHRKAS